MKFTEINDLNLKEWKEIREELYITTNALWYTGHDDYNLFKIPKRDFLPENSKTFHGLFIPEIPYQFISRFTKAGETVWDPFSGSGTTHKVAKILDRECISTDLTPTEDFIEYGDALTYKPQKNVQMIFLHPPYHDIVKYSDKRDDISNCKDVKNFLINFKKIVDNVTQYLDDSRILILVCGNIYKNSEEVSLGIYCKEIVRNAGFRLKSHIIKDYGWTKGAKNNNLMYYRRLKGGYNNFYGDNIFILQKKKSFNIIDLNDIYNS